MKWFLLLVIIVLSVFVFRQKSEIADLNAQLQTTRDQMAEVQNKAKAPSLVYDPFHKGALSPKGPVRGTMLDITPVPSGRR